jgi:hypothetical protein
MMSMMLIGDVGTEVERRGFLRVHEPACGAGGMVIAAADSIVAAGHNFQQVMHATCIDIDPCCVHMTYVQLSLLHVPATVVHGNALSMEVWGTWYTPAHILGGWTFKLRRRLEVDLLRDSVALEQQPAVDVAVSRGVVPEVAIEAEVETADVAVLERLTPRTTPAQVTNSATSLAELFEQSLASGTRERTVFDTIDQLTLF